MAYVIAEPCVGVKDKACADVCPFDAVQSDERSPQMYIDPNSCTNCGACEVECPAEAIFYEYDLPPKWRHFIELNAAYFN